MPADTSCVSHDSVATGQLAAKELLKNSSLDISAIANFCGFKAANALWKFFHQETGLSPTEWREQHGRSE